VPFASDSDPIGGRFNIHVFVAYASAVNGLIILRGLLAWVAIGYRMWRFRRARQIAATTHQQTGGFKASDHLQSLEEGLLSHPDIHGGAGSVERSADVDALLSPGGGNRRRHNVSAMELIKEEREEIDRVMADSIEKLHKTNAKLKRVQRRARQAQHALTNKDIEMMSPASPISGGIGGRHAQPKSAAQEQLETLIVMICDMQREQAEQSVNRQAQLAKQLLNPPPAKLKGAGKQ
jgi:hypothetical protein